MLAWYWQNVLWRTTMATSQQKGTGKKVMTGWLLDAFRVSREKCRPCPQPPHSLVHLRTWPSTLDDWPSIHLSCGVILDVSPHPWGKFSVPLWCFLRKNSQVVSGALPTPSHMNLHRQWGGTAGEDIRWGGRKPSVGVKYICCRPTHLFRLNPHPLLSQTQMCVWSYSSLVTLLKHRWHRKRRSSCRGPSRGLKRD